MLTELFSLVTWWIATGVAVSGADDRNPAPPDPQPSENFLVDIFSFRLPYRPQVDLHGAWEFKMDPKGVGKTQDWPKGQGVFDRTINLPGVPQAQGIGTPNFRQRNQFLDPFRVRRKFSMPAFKTNQRIWLRIGGILPAAEGRCW